MGSSHAQPKGGRKQSVYFPEEMRKEIRQEASRLDRSISQLMYIAWQISKGKIFEFPDSPKLEDE